MAMVLFHPSTPATGVVFWVLLVSQLQPYPISVCMVCCSWCCNRSSCTAAIAVSAAALGCGRCHCRLWHFCEFCLGLWHIASASWAVLYLFWQLHKLLQQASGGLIHCFICWHLQLRHAQSVAHGSHAGPAKDRLTGYQQPAEMQSDHTGLAFAHVFVIASQVAGLLICAVYRTCREERQGWAGCYVVLARQAVWCASVSAMQWLAKTLATWTGGVDGVVVCTS